VDRLQAPYRIAEGTWVIPQVLPIGPSLFGTINSMVITAKEPVLVDTGCLINRAQWLEDAFSIVEPDDVWWVYLSHGDRDHIGNVDAVLDACPNATLNHHDVGHPLHAG
jgi:glyoxylase-like metal-dependent hydrolase (beta-lactamase superfamily II)